MHCLNSRGLLLLSETLKAKWAVLYENENQILSAPTKSYLLIKHENVNNTQIFGNFLSFYVILMPGTVKRE